ncbi:MAG: adenosylcobinamide-GDP ribazoletransferase, partial [Acidimicrobiales bacterium]
ALTFLTVVGGGSRRAPTPAATTWFPVVGAGIGALLGLLWWALGRLLPLGLAAVIVVGADLAMTGMLHFDGLLDAADGLLPHLAKSRRLEVMSEPQVGAFAVGSAIVVLGARVMALATVGPMAWWKSVILLAALWAVSRALMVLVLRQQPYAKPGGIAQSLVGNSRGTRPSVLVPVVGILAGAAALVGWRAIGGVAVFAGCVVGSFGVVWLARRRIGGFTGDVLGAAGMIGETIGLVVAAARW